MLKTRSNMDHLFANVEWKCGHCGRPPGCDCWIKCECGHNYLRGKECSNQIWHISKQFADEAADLIVEDMAQSYKLFQREHMVARLKRAVIRHAQPIILATFEGVEAARAERGFKVGDMVTRDGTDVHRVTEADAGTGNISVICIRAPASGWCQVGDEEPNLARRYSRWTGKPPGYPSALDEVKAPVNPSDLNCC